jgi:glutathione S-transferase
VKLYYSPGACSQAPHIVLRELGVPHETVKVDLRKHTLPDGSDYRAINPKGYVPVLELDDGQRLTEASVILQYLAELSPGTLTPRFGTMERWRLLEWLSFVSTELHKGFSPLWNPKTPPEVRERTVEALGQRFGLLAKRLEAHDYLAGDEFSIVDAYLYVVLNWTHVHKVDLSPWPALQRFQERVAGRAAVQEALQVEGLAK